MGKSVFYYLFRGVSLVYHSPEIFLIGVSISLVGFFYSLLPESSIKTVLSLIGFFLTSFEMSFYMSMPIFLIEKQQKRPISYRSVGIVVIKNTKRLILFVIMLCVLGGILGLFLFYN